MNRSLRAVVAAGVLLAVAGGGVSAQRIINAAVVDLHKVNEAYLRESKRVRELESFVESVKSDIEQMKAEIQDLESRRLVAVQRDEKEKAEQLAGLIGQKQENLEAYRELQDRKRKKMVEDLATTDRYYGDLVDAIRWVCRQEGYSLAFDIWQTGLLWWDPEIDITEKVIEAMARR